MQKFIFSATLGFCVLLASCGGGGGGSPSAAANSVLAGFSSQPASCSIADQRGWLRAYMADQYFWNANLAAGDESASSMDAFFQSLLFKPTDRYSFSQSTAQFTQFFTEGTRTGYGYALAFTDAARTVLQVRLVEAQSPVGLAGLIRGDTIVSIDGNTPAQIAAGALAIVDTPGVVRAFSVKDFAGNVRNFSVTSANYTLTPVLASKVFTAAGGAKVGYLAYQEFIASSAGALGDAFNTFRAAGVSELIVDLRYNGGGSVTTARNLASMMGGASLDGQTFAGLRFNAKNSASNFNYAFTASAGVLPAPPLEGLARVFVITSSSTASASELVINALKPFRNVITIGATTFGKPYGFQPREACGTTYNAVNFDSVNAAGIGGYTSGLSATCAVSDDLGKALGDPAELRTAAALSYIQTGACPAAAFNVQGLQAQARAAPALSDIVAAPGSQRGEAVIGEVMRPTMLAD